MSAADTLYCSCCTKWVSPSQWDGLYGCCDGCAFCQSFLAKEGECCHGACRASDAAHHVEPAGQAEGATAP